MDMELKRIGDVLDTMATLFEQLDARLGVPQPRTTPPVVYLSGRWKLRDGTMYGR